MTKQDLIQAAPPMSVTGLTVWGLPLNEWVYILTAFYTFCLILDKLWGLWARFKQKDNNE